MLTLDVAIVAYGADGIARTSAMALPRLEGVRYIVSWQIDDPEAKVPEALRRPDVEVYRLPGRGVSRNRNNAIAHTRADIILNADDDIHYTAAGLEAVRTAFAAHPGIDFATFKYTGNTGHKVYPPAEADLRRLPKGYGIGTIELAMRRRVWADGVRFDERFGPGAPLAAGEDSVMLLTLRRLGYCGRFFPIAITRHDGAPTGARPITDMGVARAMGAIIGLSYPFTAPLRVPLKAVRMARAGLMPLLPAFVQLTAGYLRQFLMRRPWKQ